jgi:chemotaxis-related protein WspB
MLFVLFKLGADTYALDAKRVARVLPLVTLKALPQAPAGVVGLLNYRGQAIPVVDLTLGATGTPSAELMTTRIILLDYPVDDTRTALLGVVAERVSRAERLPIEKFTAPDVDVPEARYLGPVICFEGEMIQRIQIRDLLPPETRARLFPPSEPVAWQKPPAREPVGATDESEHRDGAAGQGG